MKDEMDVFLEDNLERMLDIQPPEADMKRILAGCKENKNPRVKAKAIVSIAAAALFVAAGTCAYLDGQGLLSVDSAYGERDEQDINADGIMMDNIVEDSQIDIKIKDYCRDRENLILTLEITRSDGKVFDYNSGYKNDYYFRYCDIALNRKSLVDNFWDGELIPNKTAAIIADDENPRDNILTLKLFIACAGAELKDKTLGIALYGFENRDKINVTSYEPYIKERLRGVWETEIKLDNTPYKTKIFEVNKTVELYCYPQVSVLTEDCYKYRRFNISSVSVSDIAIGVVMKDLDMIKYVYPYYGSYNNETWYVSEENLISATMKDGTVIDDLYISLWDVGVMTNGIERNFRFFFNEPVDVNQIASINVGDLVIPVE